MGTRHSVDSGKRPEIMENAKLKAGGDKDQYGTVKDPESAGDKKKMGVQNYMDDNDYLLQDTGNDSKWRKIFNEYVRPCVAEFVMVTIFVFIGTMSVHNTNSNPVGVALAHGLTIALLIAGFGSVSGGHINPAVTLGVLLSKGIKPLLSVFYILSQLLGGILGAALCRGVLGGDAYTAINGGGNLVGENTTNAEAILCEIVVTTVLVGTVLMAAVDTDGKNPGAPFAIGLAVLVDILAAGSISGASMNPARSLGPCIVLSPFKSIWGDFWIYIVGPIIGALLAAILYRVLLARDDKRLVCTRKN